MAKRRPLCNVCQQRQRAVNYIRNGIHYYRSRCAECEKSKKQEKSLEGQALLRSGYKKRDCCDRCNFKARHASQLSIVFLDGNRLNVGRENLRTYCANCIAELSALPNRNKTLIPDY